MMKICEITQSGSFTDLGQDFRAVADMIERDCTQYLASARKAGGWLRRGEGGTRPYMFLASSRQHRNPLHSHKQAAEYWDLCLKKLGFTALRSNSIFATSNPEHAAEFGRVYVVFPLDRRSAYTYTNQLDITLGRHNIGRMVNHDKLTPVIDDLAVKLRRLPETTPAITNHVLNKMTPVTDRMAVWNVLDKNRDKYISVGADPRWFDIDISQFLDEKTFEKNFQPSNTNLDHAISDHLEVYITGEYYAMLDNYYSIQLSERFGI
jgi:hypothetical protein